ncbi:hypothetical protein J6590_026561 [Homalodisca vitripennis]|nr:hypothetical protein J6590_095698 [Homalodisca vitripennis]KAG8322304.1 hypothetical protein J6590_026561 [Homalodisca vitripennis]
MDNRSRIDSEDRDASGLVGSVPEAGPGQVDRRLRRRCDACGFAPEQAVVHAVFAPTPWPHPDLSFCKALAVWSCAGPYRVSPIQEASCLRGQCSMIDSELAQTRRIRLRQLQSIAMASTAGACLPSASSRFAFARDVTENRHRDHMISLKGVPDAFQRRHPFTFQSIRGLPLRKGDYLDKIKTLWVMTPQVLLKDTARRGRGCLDASWSDGVVATTSRRAGGRATRGAICASDGHSPAGHITSKVQELILPPPGVSLQGASPTGSPPEAAPVTSPRQDQ